MTAEEEQAQLKRELSAERAKCARLEGELARERAENASLRQMLEEVLRRLSEVEGQLAKDSHNSSKPPSSDGPGRKRVSPHRRSEKKTGGQPGHPGHTLKIVDTPDEVVKHRPVACQRCQQPLEEVAGKVKERRPVHDLPEVRLRVCEHHVEEVCCPACGQQTVGSFPAEVMAPAQYGPNVQALAVYLYQGQLVPMARTCEVLDEVCGCHLSQGTLLRWVQEASGRLVTTVEKIADWLSVGRLQHGDETGVRIAGKRH
jgi:transposase